MSVVPDTPGPIADSARLILTIEGGEDGIDFLHRLAANAGASPTPRKHHVEGEGFAFQAPSGATYLAVFTEIMPAQKRG